MFSAAFLVLALSCFVALILDFFECMIDLCSLCSGSLPSWSCEPSRTQTFPPATGLAPQIDQRMSFMKGDLLSRTRKLVKGLAKAEPVWLKAMEQAPPATFPRAENKLEPISLPEDVYIKKFFQKHPESKHEDAIKISGFDPPPARIFGWRVLELKEQGVSEEEAMAVADMGYRAEKKAKKKAYSRLKQIARLEGKKPPPNPYPSAIKEIQAEERKFVRDRFCNRDILKIVEKLKDERQVELQDRRGGGGW